jgi:NAD(P)-dependent dehydrogenase (short-subunit alcohol dehydrogenase family)
MAPTFETADADFDFHFHTNVQAPYVLVQQLVPGMIERGHGSVVNVSTMAATTPAAGAGIYGASKAALDLLTKLWADEFGDTGVRVNAVAPGPVQTEGTAELGDLIDGLARTTAMKRLGEPEEIARAVAFLASPAASYVNGAVLQVGGGAQAIRPAA